MKKRSHLLYKAMINRFFIVIVIFTLAFIICCGNKKYINVVSNTNAVKSIEAVHIVSKYNNKDEQLVVKHVSNMQEASLYGPEMPISFIGQMTAYKATCKGCTGKVYCPPRQDVRKNNIYYNDDSYGTVRIMAADYAIPCGTIVKITNVSFTNQEIIGIVLDRGGAIKGNIMDFLVGENDNMDIVGRQRNVNYEILRWGW